jgi:hypothetical protein
MSAQARNYQTPGLSPQATTLEGALYYPRELGWSVFPVSPDKIPYANEKVSGGPVPQGMGGFHLATTDPTKIRRWWARWPDALIGVAITGWCVVEADVRAGGDVALAEFCTLHGIDLSNTVQAHSASGGLHCYFRDEPGLRRAISFLTGVDFLASGKGYVTVAPSRRKGGQYTWVEGHAPWECDMAEMPVALREAIEQSFGQGTAYAYKAKVAGYASSPRSQTVTNLDSYIRTVRENVSATISSVAAGQRRDVLNREGFTLGRFVGGGYIPRHEVRADICSAFQRAGHRLDHKAEETIDVGLDEGAAQPIRLVVEERVQLRSDSLADDGPADGPPLIQATPAVDGCDMVSINPHFLKALMLEASAATTMRARYHRTMAIVGDKAMNDGQKLTAIALSAKLPVCSANTTPAPVTVYAETIARDLGSKVTKKDGKERPTKLGTVTKNLADLVNLGVCKREVVEQVKTITIPNKRDRLGQPIQETITVTSYAYQGGGSLPGQRMDRDEAREAATGAKADRERPRCPRCYSTNLKPSSYVCLKCDTVSSDVATTRAGQEIVDHGAGQFRHRDTGEIVVPGVPIEGDFATQPPDTGIQYRGAQPPKAEAEPESNHTEDANAPIPADENTDDVTTGQSRDRIPVLASDEFTEDRHAEEEGGQYRNPVTIVRRGQGYRIPVLAPVAEQVGETEAETAQGARMWTIESSLPATPCRYESHRGHEWARPDGRGLVCGVCHPQPPPRALHIPDSAAPGQGQGQGVRS